MAAMTRMRRVKTLAGCQILRHGLWLCGWDCATVPTWDSGAAWMMVYSNAPVVSALTNPAATDCRLRAIRLCQPRRQRPLV